LFFFRGRIVGPTPNPKPTFAYSNLLQTKCWQEILTKDFKQWLNISSQDDLFGSSHTFYSDYKHVLKSSLVKLPAKLTGTDTPHSIKDTIPAQTLFPHIAKIQCFVLFSSFYFLEVSL
jgi:hypothetical protein